MSGMDVGTIAAVHKLSKAGGSLLTSSKGFATAAAALCSFALVEAFMARANVKRIHVSILNPLCLMGLLIGAMLPFVLGTMVLSAITRVAHKMKEEIQEQFEEHKEEILYPQEDQFYRPHYDDVIEHATQESLLELAPIGLFLLMLPVSAGLLFGKACVAALVIGCILSGVPFAVSASNSGGVWEMVVQDLASQGKGPTNDYDGALFALMVARDGGDRDQIAKAEEKVKKSVGMPDHQAAEVCAAVGEQLKDAVGPAINIMMKELAITAVVFGPFFANVRGGFGTIGCSLTVDCDSSKYPLEGFDYVIILATIVFVLAIAIRAAMRFYNARRKQSDPLSSLEAQYVQSQRSAAQAHNAVLIDGNATRIDENAAQIAALEGRLRNQEAQSNQ